MKLGNVRMFSNSKITILPGKKYTLSINRKDLDYYDDIKQYAERISNFINLDYLDDSFSFSIKIKKGKIKRIKPLNNCSKVINDTMANK